MHTTFPQFLQLWPRRTKLFALVIFASTMFVPSLTRADKEVRIPAGKSVDVWWGVNVSGSVQYIIRTRDGSNTVKFWWIKWGVGSIEEVGFRTDSGVLNNPISVFKGVMAAKLRASSDVDAVVHIEENSAPATGVTFHWD